MPHRCWYCDHEILPVYYSLSTVFIPGMGYLVKGGKPIMYTCVNETCRNFMKGSYERCSNPDDVLHLQVEVS